MKNNLLRRSLLFALALLPIAVAGGLGLVFGRLYRKYGVQYAMLCHILCHVIAKGVWFLAG